MLVAAMSLVAAACGGAVNAGVGGGVAATYEGGEISADDVYALIPIPLDSDTVDTGLFAGTLTRLILDRIFTAAAEQDYEITADDATVAENLVVLTDSITNGGQLEFSEGLETAGLTEEGLQAIARQQAIFDEVSLALIASQPAPDEAEMRELYESQIQTISEVCSRHILLESEEEAIVTLDRALAGEDFAELAIELSTGPSGPDGGDLGCGAPGGFVPEFAQAIIDAEPGVPIGPVETQFGWHVILVESKTIPTFEESRQDIENAFLEADVSVLFNEWLGTKMEAANVQVDEQYGSWTLDPQPAVIPPGS